MIKAQLDMLSDSRCSLDYLIWPRCEILPHWLHLIKQAPALHQYDVRRNLFECVIWVISPGNNYLFLWHERNVRRVRFARDKEYGERRRVSTDPSSN